MRWKGKKGIVILFFVNIMFYGCGQNNRSSVLENDIFVKEYQQLELQEIKSNEEDTDEDFSNIDIDTLQTSSFENDKTMTIYYNIISKKHEILERNICTVPRSVYDDPWLMEQLEIKTKDAEFLNQINQNQSQTSRDYFLYDLNDDGINEYFIWFGKSIEIYQKSEEGNLKLIYERWLGVHVNIKSEEGIYYPIVILNEKTEGYYSFLLPPAYHEVCKYNKEMEKYDSEYLPIAYDIIRENYEVINENICINPVSVYDNPFLMECLRDEIEDAEWYEQFSENPSKPQIDYFVFDFNDDEVDEYLVCWSGAGWTGTAGQRVDIYQKTEEGNLKMIFGVVARLIDYSGGYYPIAVLNEKTDGYYAFVLPSDNNTIWKFNKEIEGYDFSENGIIQP